MSRVSSRAHGPRMVDVAALAGVSQQTVSRVINGAPNVSPEIRERTEKAIAQLRYRRNTAAAALASNRTMNIGVVSYSLSVHGPSVALYGISEQARRNGYSTRLITLGDVGRSSIRHALDELTADEVDGIIVLVPLGSAVETLRGLDSRVPIVTFEQGSAPGASSVSIDEVHGAQLAVRHLLELGHETVAHVGGPEGWMASEARERGWSTELALARRVARPVLRTADWSVAEGYRAGVELAADPDVTAVFAANDPFALGVIKAFDDHGIRVPADRSVVGFDDVPEAGYYRPSLSTVHLDFAEVGQLAVDRVFALMRGEAVEPLPLIAPTLVARGSSAAPR
ncbi:LacI family DNA-binding transcriptional regulator [Rathayibacter sp. PhB179]|uniref:LacI family DNA-binding transcriptional regulator n=1 Tax=unclassified Rathayibacter TaxID=2609250 RepID=UPI003260FF06